MSGRKHTRDSIVTTLQSLAKHLGKQSLSTQDVSKVLALSSVNEHFGSLGKAQLAAGLEPTERGANLRGRANVLSDENLFADLRVVEQALGHEPGFNEYSANGRYSIKPFKQRFGVWRDVLARYRKWKADSPLQRSLKDGADSPPVSATEVVSDSRSSVPNKAYSLTSAIIVREKKDRPQLYGEPIDFRGLRHAPINEQGVVYLFGMVSRELGFSIESVQQGFPDCEGKYLYDSKKNLWAKARIEIEYSASSFREHGHNADLCDFIVCWIDDWPDSPIQVIELRKEILKLPVR